MVEISANDSSNNDSSANFNLEQRQVYDCSLIPYVYVLTYICMYIHYCTIHAAPQPLEYTDIATYTGLVCLALLPKPQTLFTILVNYAYAS